ncbi:MAG: ribosomal protein small subunit ribosomal protein [Parcubacteria group bacterium]|nr:ribosomal protein small subunit ribosomal protein [Parcubacteria group bacterium]
MIRFQRIGRKNDAAFRMAVLEKTAGPKAGKYVDLVGTYNPKTKAMTVKADRIKEWMAKGAQVSPSLMNLLINKGILEGTKSAVISKQNLEKHIAKRKAEEEAAAAKAAEAAEKEAAATKAAEEAAAAAPAEEAAPEEVVAEVTEEEAAPAVEEAAPAETEEVAA